MNSNETFLVLERQALVQVDLTQSIQEVCPQAEVFRASSVDEAGRLLDGVERLVGAIVGVGGSVLKDSGLAQRIEDLGGWIICLNGGDADVAMAEGWHSLAEPFSSDDAHRLIRSLMDQQRPAPAAE